MSGSYEASFLPLESGAIDPVFFMEELIYATAKL